MKHMLLVVACGGLLAAESADVPTTSPARPRLVIAVNNFARVPASTVARAERSAGRILRQAGIEAAWLDCSAESDTPRADPSCQEAGPMQLELWILPDVPPNLPTTSIGIAFRNAVWPVKACVFYPRVAGAADANRIISVGDLLGIATAHELGHLLLGTGGHSPAGVMKARWSRLELRLALVEQLRFSSEQSARMRAEVARRAWLEQPDAQAE